MAGFDRHRGGSTTSRSPWTAVAAASDGCWFATAKLTAGAPPGIERSARLAGAWAATTRTEARSGDLTNSGSQ